MLQVGWDSLVIPFQRTWLSQKTCHTLETTHLWCSCNKHLQTEIRSQSSSRTLPLRLDRQNQFGNTALHLAVRQGPEEKVRWILDNGGDFTIKDENGYDSLAIARERHSFNNTQESAEIYQMLRNKSEAMRTSTMTMDPQADVAWNHIQTHQDTTQPSASREQETSDKPCVICFGARTTKCVFLNCFHSSCCYECAWKIFMSHEKKCPICRTHIDSVKRIFE